MKEKRCHQCGQTKPFNQFGRNRRACDGREDMCKVCTYARFLARDRYRQAMGYTVTKPGPAEYRKAKYGIDQETYDLMFERQNGRCAICGCEEQLVVDHDHHLEEYGPLAFRGLLCGQCNLGLGAFKDNPKLLRAAIKYLQAFKVY